MEELKLNLTNMALRIVIGGDFNLIRWRIQALTMGACKVVNHELVLFRNIKLFHLSYCELSMYITSQL